MDKKTKKITIVTSCALMLLGIVVAPQVTKADDITVSGNGQSSTNSVSVSSNQQSTPQQTNTSQVTNNTNTSSSTGGNTASSNSGNATVATGNANASTTVNTAANASSIDQNCCTTQGASETISGNGENATNSVDVSSSTINSVVVNQNAQVTNNVSQYADTGHNAVNGNGGNVSIKTGDINAEINIKNGPINVSNINIPSGNNGSLLSKIDGNGEDSTNTITQEENNTTLITINNSATVINNLKTKYITGNNTAVSNNGNVTIATGGIASLINVVNGPINANSVTVTCCNQNTKPTTPPTSTPSGNMPSSSSTGGGSGSSSGNGSSSSSGGPGSVLGASASNLPVTGSYWFFIALIGNILVMLMGGYLRLRSGRSPGYAGAF
jgi:hypothetical protein